MNQLRLHHTGDHSYPLAGGASIARHNTLQLSNLLVNLCTSCYTLMWSLAPAGNFVYYLFYCSLVVPCDLALAAAVGYENHGTIKLHVFGCL